MKAAAAAPRGLTLKLYIDSTSLSVVHQMADFVACADRADVVKVITWLRCPLSEAQLQGAQALYVRQLAAVSPAFVELVLKLVQRYRPQQLELHSNHHHARSGVLPVLRALLARRLLEPAQVRLHLYDDGRLSLRHRDELAALPDPAQALADGAQALRSHLLDGTPLRWNLATSYGWPAVFDTRLHMMRPERLLQAVPGLDGWLRQAVQAMRFDHAQTLGARRWARYLGWYGLADEQRDALRGFAADPTSFVFVGMSVWDPEENRRRRRLQIDTIAALRERGLLPAGRLGFKGHPANLEGEHELRAALGEDVFAVPARLPLEVMMMDGLLPASLGGVISTAYLNLPPQRLRFMICNATDADDCLAQPDVQVMLELGLIDAGRIHPWLQPAAVAA